MKTQSKSNMSIDQTDQPPTSELTAMVPPSLQEGIQLSEQLAEPYYVQLQRQIQGLIDSGKLASGTYMPSERDLADWLHVSRTTVKRAYDELRKAQVIISSQGRGGTMVQGTPRVSPIMQRLKGFTEEMQELGLTPSTRLLELEVVQDRTIASLFKRPSNAPLLRVLRLRLGDEVPMSRELAWYDLTMAPALENWNGEGSVYAFLRNECGIGMVWAEQSIEAVSSSADESAAFGFNTPAPCLLIKRKSYDTADRVIEYVEGTFRGDAYAYRLKLQG